MEQETTYKRIDPNEINFTHATKVKKIAEVAAIILTTENIKIKC